MKYLLHTTTMAMRRALLENSERDFVLKEIKVDDFLAPTIAINEDTGELYWVDYQPMLDTLKEFDAGMLDMENTTYYKKWASVKGEEATKNRVSGFYDIYTWIKEAGLKTPVAVECTGQKLDGSHRAAIMKHLGYTTIPAREYTLKHNEADEDFFRRTAQAREMLFGLNYYFIDYGGFTNLTGDIPVIYKDNASKWGKINEVVGKAKTILDLGCNEGLMSIGFSFEDKKVTGYDHEFIEGANFNNLLLKGSATFIEADITEVDFPKADVALLLCVLYHVPKGKKVPLLRELRKKVKRLVLQGNLRKAHEVELFKGCTVETMRELLEESGWKVESVIEYGDKPIVTAV